MSAPRTKEGFELTTRKTRRKLRRKRDESNHDVRDADAINALARRYWKARAKRQGA